MTLTIGKYQLDIEAYKHLKLIGFKLGADYTPFDYYEDGVTQLDFVAAFYKWVLWLSITWGE